MSVVPTKYYHDALMEVDTLRARIAELEGERDAHKAKNDVTSVGISALIHVYEAADRLAEECDEDTWEVEEVRMRDLHSALERYEEIAENGGEVCGPITQLTAERDNALRYTELLIQERDNAKSKELEVLRLRIAELEGERDAHKADAGAFRDLAYQVPGLKAERDAAKAEAEKAKAELSDALTASGANWKAYLGESAKSAIRQSHIGAELSMAEEKNGQLSRDLDLARAEASRAVEVVQKLLKSAVPNRRDHPTMWDAWAFATKFLEGNPPALDWLAQVNREAAAEELEKLGPLGSSNQELFMVPWGEIKQRAAALRAGKGVQDAE